MPLTFIQRWSSPSSRRWPLRHGLQCPSGPYLWHPLEFSGPPALHLKASLQCLLAFLRNWLLRRTAITNFSGEFFSCFVSGLEFLPSDGKKRETAATAPLTIFMIPIIMRTSPITQRSLLRPRSPSSRRYTAFAAFVAAAALAFWIPVYASPPYD